MSNATIDPPSRMTREQAAEFLGVTPATLANWSSTGRHGLRYTRIGRRTLYLRSDLEAFIASRTGTSCREIEARASA